MSSIPKYAVLEAKDVDSVCPIMIAEGIYEGVVFIIDVVSINDDGVLSYNYNVLSGEVDNNFKNTVGDILVEMLEEQLLNDDRNEHSESASS
mgnify:FL=1